MTTPAKLVTSNNTAIDMKKYEDMDVDQLLAQLSPEEIQMLAKEVDPDVSILLFSLRKSATTYQLNIYVSSAKIIWPY